MKKIMMKLSVLTATLLLTANVSFGQDDQMVQFANLGGETTFSEYSIKFDEKTKVLSVVGVTAVDWTFSSKDYHDSFKELAFKEIPKDEFYADKMPVHRYFPDEEAFPATFVGGSWLGGPEEIEKYDVVEKNTTDRFVIVGDWIYQLENWKNKDDYDISRLFLKGQVPSMAGLKEAMKFKKNDPGDEFKKRLQDYLDAAFAKQAELLPAWNEANKAVIAKRAENFKACWASLNDENDAYWNSAKGMAKAGRMARGSTVSDTGNGEFIVTNTGDEAVIYYNDSNNAESAIGAGQSKTFKCYYDVFYDKKNDDGSTVGVKISGASSCGNTINI